MRIAIDNPIRNISPDVASHRSAWAYLWREWLLEDGNECDVLHDCAPWDGYDQVWIYCGMEFNGQPNMFDGLSGKVFDRMDRFVQNRATIPYKLIETPVEAIFRRRMRIRVGNPTTDPRATAEWIESICDTLQGTPLVTQHALNTPKEALVIGDSHALSVWRPGAYCKRMDGKTLRGLSQSLPEDAKEFTSKYPIKSMTVCAGNIDIRHHLFRKESPKAYLGETLERLEETVKRMEIPDVELVGALPIEDESRHLRKSVCLEGSKFSGSWAERTGIARHFNDEVAAMAARNGWRTWFWPEEWWTETARDPKWFFTRMEKPYSVHLSREFYRWKVTGAEEVTKSSSPAKVLPAQKPDNYDTDEMFG